MAILIKGMEMPKRCEDCWLMDSEDSWCCACYGKPLSADYRYGTKERPSWCPLVELPPQWIPVTERLPEEDGWYQVYAPWYSGGSSSGLKNINGNMYSAFKHGKWSIEVGYHKRPGCVKAWMPLPEPPKEESPTIIEAEGVSK